MQLDLKLLATFLRLRSAVNYTEILTLQDNKSKVTFFDFSGQR